MRININLKLFLCSVICSEIFSDGSADRLRHGRSELTQPNILLFVVDDLGYNDIGYHNSEIETPFIDDLAYEGVRLENYYVQPLCTPSRSQLLTGRYDIHTGLQHEVIHSLQPNGMPLDLPTVAEKLQEAGYATHLVGKWHLGHHEVDYLPKHRGFDTYFGFLNGMGRFYSHDGCESFKIDGVSRPFCGYDFLDGDLPYWQAAGHYSTDLFVQRSKELVSNHTKYSPDKPIFLDVSFQAVHYPLEVPKEYEDRFMHIEDETRRKYVAMVSTVDDAVRDIVNAFKNHGLWENTIVIFTTDNGGGDMYGGNNYPLRGYKTTLWEGGIRAVGFVHGKGLDESAGTINNELLHISDWFPTLVHLAGLETTDITLDGYDIWHTISTNYPSPRTELLHNIDPLIPLKGNRLHNSPFDNRVSAAIRKDNWKLLTGNPGDGSWYKSPTLKEARGWKRDQFDASEYTHESSEKNLFRLDLDKHDTEKNIWLFDISTDPEETTDLSQFYPRIVEELLAKLAYYNSTAVPCRYPPMDPAGDPAIQPGLRRGTFGPWM